MSCNLSTTLELYTILGSACRGASRRAVVYTFHLALIGFNLLILVSMSECGVADFFCSCESVSLCVDVVGVST